MKKNVLLTALSALTLTACVNDETIQVNKGDEVAFRAVAGHATRSVTTTTGTISEFKVWGFHENEGETKTFMDGVAVNRINDSWTYSPTQFWPEAGTIDFFSVSPGATAVQIDKTTKTIPNFTVPSDVDEQIDLLYAANYDCSKEANGVSGVEVNFRHALSQIVFQAKNINAKLEIEIGGVEVQNIIDGGTLTFPTKTTSPNLSDTDNDTETDESWGKWSLGSNKSDFAAGTTKKTVKATSGTVRLTSSGGELLLMPQTLTAWVPSASTEGNRFVIDCKIWNVEGKDKTLLYPASDEAYGQVAIPVDGTWKQGKRYVYTFIFGEGAGYNPETGESVFAEIKYDVTVDEFQEGDQTDVDMDVDLESAINMDVEVPAENLTYGGGNCWVIPSNASEALSYYFDATKEGQSNDPVGTVVEPVDDVRAAKLVWETEENLISMLKYKEGGKLLFTVDKGKTGNAVVAVTDGEGTILWSWHVWVVADNAFMNTALPSGTFMDRNLGAMAGTPDKTDFAKKNEDTWGLYYEWGRKDPQQDQGRGGKKIGTGPVEIAVTVQHPDWYYKSPQGTPDNPFIAFKAWYDVDEVSAIWDDVTLMKKYNPAPKGWTVPSADDFTKLDIERCLLEGTTNRANLVTKDKQLFFPGANGITSHSGYITSQYGLVYWTRDQAQLEDGGSVIESTKKYYSRSWGGEIAPSYKSTGASIRAVRE